MFSARARTCNVANWRVSPDILQRCRATGKRIRETGAYCYYRDSSDAVFQADDTTQKFAELEGEHA